MMSQIPLSEFSAGGDNPIIQAQDLEANDDYEHDYYGDEEDEDEFVRPISVSEPLSLPNPVTSGNSDRKFSSSSPLLKFYREKEPVPSKATATATATATTPIRNSYKACLKWTFVILNVLIEVCQAVFTQEAAAATEKRRRMYRTLAVVTSSVCFVMSFVDAVHQGWSNGVVWRRREGCRCCFYYPPPDGRLFGRISIYFGIVCSTLQLTLNLIAKLMNKDFVKFDYVPLLLSLCYLVATMVGSHGDENEKTSVIVLNCRTHGYNVAQTAIVDHARQKSLVFQCPECQLLNLP